MKKYYYIHTRTGRKFEIINVDLEAGTITLKGETSEFVETFDKERFKELGYRRAVEEVEEEAEVP